MDPMRHIDQIGADTIDVVGGTSFERVDHGGVCHLSGSQHRTRIIAQVPHAVTFWMPTKSPPEPGNVTESFPLTIGLEYAATIAWALQAAKRKRAPRRRPFEESTDRCDHWPPKVFLMPSSHT